MIDLDQHVSDLIEQACRDVAEYGLCVPAARVLSGNADAHTMRLGIPPRPADAAEIDAWQLDLLDTRERIARAVDALGLSAGDYVLMLCMTPIDRSGDIDFAALLTVGQVGVGAEWTRYLMPIENTEKGSRLLPPLLGRAPTPAAARYEA